MHKVVSYPFSLSVSGLLWLGCLVWPALTLLLVVLNHYQTAQEVTALSRQTAEQQFQARRSYQRWAAWHGGVWVPRQPQQQLQQQTTSPKASPKGKTALLPSPEAFVRLPPVIMSQQALHFGNTNLTQQGIQTRLIGKHSAQRNSWQKQLLAGASAQTGLRRQNSSRYYRLLQPVQVRQDCLDCHQQWQGQVGSIQGALTIEVAKAPFARMLAAQKYGADLLLLSIGSLGMGLSLWRRHRIQQEITRRNEANNALEKSRKLYSALCQANQALLRGHQVSQLYQRICDIAVDHGFRLAWIGELGTNGNFTPVARAGIMQDYVDAIEVSSDPRRPTGQGPTGQAIREQRTVVINDFLQQLANTPWYTQAVRYGIRSSVAMPIFQEHTVVGAFKVYADEPHYFTPERINLLEQLAADISLGLQRLQEERQRREAEAEMRQTLAVNQKLLDSLPYPAMLARRSDGRVVHSNRRAQEMGAQVGEICPCCGLPDRNEPLDSGQLERYCEDGRWEMVCWSPVEGDLYLHFAIDITERKNQEQQTAQLANYDPLTGLCNRRLFQDTLERVLAQGQRQNSPTTLLLLDLDEFKAINDNHGHNAGDAVLTETAQRLQQSVRNMDTVARLGGDEFVVILPDTAEDNLRPLLSRILAAFAEPIAWEDQLFQVRLSIGSAQSPEQAADDEKLLAQADQAMYAAKERNWHYCSYGQLQQSGAQQNVILLEERLPAAMAGGEFCLYYQPLLTVEQKIIAYEALLRWQHPQWGLLRPGAFLPQAEKSQRLQSLGRHSRQLALAQLARWRSQGHQYPLHLNVSNQELRSSDFEKDLLSDMQQYGIPATALALEIAESLPVQSPDVFRQLCQRLTARGIAIYLDNFGCGQSSINLLQRLPVTGFKIDRSFVQNIGPDPAATPNDATIIETIISLGVTLKRQIIATGVETKAQEQFLQQFAVTAMQGHLWAPPQKAASIHPGQICSTPDCQRS